MRTMACCLGGAAALMGLGLLGACGDDGDTAAAGPTGAGITCAPTNPSCPAVGIESECLALVDNSGEDVFALRLSQLTVAAPAALANPVVATVVSDGVLLNLPNSCNVTGMGTFNFVTVFDKTTGMLRAGGAYPVEDPTQGYCFVEDAANGVMPIEIESNLMEDGSFSTAPLDVVVPVFTDQQQSSVVYLPLKEARILNAQITADQNCIGKYNVDGLLPANNCAPDGDEDYFVSGADLEGYITIEDADLVDVELLGQSLCVLLSGDPATYGDGAEPIQRCVRDTNGDITLEGDWCSDTNSAGGCMDAFRLEGRVAASAVKIADSCP